MKKGTKSKIEIASLRIHSLGFVGFIKLPILFLLSTFYFLLFIRLSYQIPLITGLAIITTILVNIVAFHYFMGTLFVAYTEEMASSEQRGSLSPEKLQAVLDVSTLPGTKQDEYKAVVNELSTISTSLQNISENPSLYIQSGSGNVQASDGIYAINIGSKVKKSHFESITAMLSNPTGWDNTTPEGRLVIGLLMRLIGANALWLCCILFLYALWIRRVFAPVHLIIDRLRSYIDSARYQTISYTRHDEFAPLVSTINSLQQSLRLQEEIRSTFLSDISHEIRTPITAVKCYLEAIEDGMMTLDNRTITLLQKELTRLTDITEQIMQYEHLTHHSTDDIQKERFALGKKITPLIHEYLPQLERKNQQILITSEHDIFIRMDSDMCVQILHNIFSNFVKYAGNGATLSCSYTKTPTTIQIIFSDDGVGIPESEVALVREKFYRVDKSRTRDTTMSMGIGLSIIDHIVRIHDGYLDIANTKPHGLMISMVIPR